MLVKTRKNKGYTSILLQELSEEAFKEAKNVFDSIEGYKIVKPTSKAWQSFIKLHSLTLDMVEEGEEYKVFGTTFTVIRNLDYSRGDNEWNSILRYFDRNKNRYEEVGILNTENFAIGVHEICFKNKTGILLYY